MPTRKWWANMVTGATALAIAWATTGTWDQEETVALIGLVSAGVIAWLIPNDPSKSGV